MEKKNVQSCKSHGTDPMIAFPLKAENFTFVLRAHTRTEIEEWTVSKVLFTLVQDIVINLGIKVAVSLNIGSGGGSTKGLRRKEVPYPIFPTVSCEC